ncbi:MAG TPA: oxidoreductase, partial [Candidatus Competibacteraceae bacterium]|nr:oxidoreductase [Candidatus Competibacteraceae bacterium]
MRRIIQNRQIIEDQWRQVADDEALPPQGAILVSLARWQQERETLLARPERQLGIRLKNDMPVADIVEDLPYVA